MIPKLYNGHDKTFFFFNWEQFRESLVVANGLTTVPTLDYRQGDFSKALINPLTIAGQPPVDALGRPLVQNELFDPNTTRTAPDGSSVRDPFPNNVIPMNRMDPVAAKYIGARVDIVPRPVPDPNPPPQVAADKNSSRGS